MSVQEPMNLGSREHGSIGTKIQQRLDKELLMVSSTEIQAVLPYMEGVLGLQSGRRNDTMCTSTRVLSNI